MSELGSQFTEWTTEQKLELAEVATNKDFKLLLRNSIFINNKNILMMEPDISNPMQTVQTLIALQLEIAVYTDILNALEEVLELHKEKS